MKNFNAYLDNLQSMLYQAHKQLTEAGEFITADSIQNKFLGKEEKTHKLLEAVKDHNLKMKALVGKEYAAGTLKRFEVLERHLSAFMQEKYKIADISSPHIIQVAKPEEIIALYLDVNNNVAINDLTNTKYGCQGWTVEEILYHVMGM